MSWNKGVKACSEFEADLEDFVSNELDASKRVRVEKHLRECASCSEAVKIAIVSRNVLQKAIEPAVDPGAFFVRQLMTAIRVEEDRAASGFWKPLEILSLRAAWTAAAALAILLTYGAVSGIPVKPPMADNRAAEPAGLFTDAGTQGINPDLVLTYVGEANHGHGQ
jgi:anti-sigma factor RsiW